MNPQEPKSVEDPIVVDRGDDGVRLEAKPRTSSVPRKVLEKSKANIDAAIKDVHQKIDQLVDEVKKTVTPDAHNNRSQPEHNYGQTSLANDPAAARSDYGKVETINAERLQPAVVAGRISAEMARAVPAAHEATVRVYDQVLTANVATDIPTARQARTRALNEAKTAELEAKKAEVEAAKPAATPEEKALAERVRKSANSAKKLAKDLDLAVRKAEGLRRVFKDDAGRTITSRVVVACLGAVGLVGILGALGYVIAKFAFPTSSGNSAQPTEPKDLEIDALNSESQVTVDVLGKNSLTTESVNGVLLVDSTKPVTTPPATTATLAATDSSGKQIGSWTAKGTEIVYTPAAVGAAAVNPPRVQYVLQLTSPSGALSNTAKLTVSLFPKAADIVVAASDQISAVSISVPSGFAYVTPGDAGWGAPVTASGSASVTFTPANQVSPVVSLVVAEPFMLGQIDPINGGPNIANLVILFPPAASPSAPAAAMNASRTDTTLFALPPAGPATWTLLDANGNATSKPQPYGTAGNWILDTSLTPNTIAFQGLGDMNASTTGTQVSYALMYGQILSKPATVALTLAAVGATPTLSTAIDFTSVAPDRVSPSYPVPLPGGIVLSGITGANWTLNGGQALFTPPPNFSATSAVATYTSAGLAASTLGSATLTLVFPADIAVNMGNRMGVTSIDLTSSNPLITDPFTVSFNPAVDAPTQGSWSWGLSEGHAVALFTPPPDSPVTSASVTTQYTLRFGDGTTTKAKLTLNFSIIVSAMAAVDSIDASTTQVTHNVLAHVYAPGGVQKVLLNGKDTYTQKNDAGKSLATWSVSGAGPATKVHLDVLDRSAAVFSVPYSVVDANGKESSPSVIVLQKDPALMPRAVDFLVADMKLFDGDTLGMDVLAACSAFWGKDESSVVLTGLQDVGMDNNAPEALLHNDGKQLVVPGEGIWLVCDGGQIAYTRNPGVTRMPTPVGFRFSDNKGNQSNIALIIVNPDLTDVLALPTQLAALDDDTFWSNFQNAVDGEAVMSTDVFMTLTSTLATLTHAQGPVGPCPVTTTSYDAAFEKWMVAKHHWDGPAGVGLFSICADLVDDAMADESDTSATLALGARYWRLEMMARMTTELLS